MATFCVFCKSEDDVQGVLPELSDSEEPAALNMCAGCRGVSGRCREEPLFWDCGGMTYVDAPPQPDGSTAVVLDLHNVVDTFLDGGDYEAEIVGLINALDKVTSVYLLSYVGAGTSTRLRADEMIRGLMAKCPKLRGYLSFVRSGKAGPSTKGGFIALLGKCRVVFLDDSKSHLKSAAAVGAECYKIAKAPKNCPNPAVDYAAVGRASVRDAIKKAVLPDLPLAQ
jgi:hypothetical protein